MYARVTWGYFPRKKEMNLCDGTLNIHTSSLHNLKKIEWREEIRRND